MRSPLLPLCLLAAACARGEPEKGHPPLSHAARDHIARMASVFDGKTLDGWVQLPPYPVRFSREDVADPAALAEKLLAPEDPASEFIGGKLDAAAKASLRENPDPKRLASTLAKVLDGIAAGPSLHAEEPFRKLVLRQETSALAAKLPRGEALARLNRLLLEDAFPAELVRSPQTSWIVKDGAMASTGAGRGVIHTAKEYTKYRLVFTMRHLGGPPGDHAPCVLVFCTAPRPGEPGLDALGGIQFQPPNGGSWDYRPGKNNGGKGLFTRMAKPGFDSREWHRVELLVDADKGSARMAVAQPPDARAVEVLRFHDPAAGRSGPFAWQMHNRGLFDEFKDVRIEENPLENRLVTTE